MKATDRAILDNLLSAYFATEKNSAAAADLWTLITNWYSSLNSVKEA